MSPHVRQLVGLVGCFVGWSAIISKRGGVLHFHAPIVALVAQIISRLDDYLNA